MSRFALINDVRTEAPEGAIAYKYADPTEDARWLTEESEVRQIRSEDPSLVVIVTDEDDESDIIAGETVQHDASGQGHAWQAVTDDNCPANIRQEIASEIIDGGQTSCSNYVASNGQHYRW